MCRTAGKGVETARKSTDGPSRSGTRRRDPGPSAGLGRQLGTRYDISYTTSLDTACTISNKSSRSTYPDIALISQATSKVSAFEIDISQYCTPIFLRYCTQHRSKTSISWVAKSVKIEYRSYISKFFLRYRRKKLRYRGWQRASFWRVPNIVSDIAHDIDADI